MKTVNTVDPTPLLLIGEATIKENMFVEHESGLKLIPPLASRGQRAAVGLAGSGCRRSKSEM